MPSVSAVPFLPRRTLGAYALLCAGYALCFSASPLSPVGTAVLTRNGIDNLGLCWVRGLFLAVAVLAVNLEVRRMRAGAPTTGARVLEPGLAAVGSFAVLHLGSASDMGVWTQAVYACLLGYGLGSFMPRWIELFSAVHRDRGRIACVAALACSFVVSTGLSALVDIMGYSTAVAVGLAALVALACWGCWVAVGRLKAFADAGAPSGKAGFAPTRYTCAVAVSLGVTWALAYNLAPSLGFAVRGPGISSSLLMLLGYALSQVTLVLVVWRAGIERVNFGLVLRWLIAIVGIGWAFVPILAALAPRLGCFVLVTVFLIQSVLVNLFIIELAHESRFALVDVFAHFTMLFVGGALAASLLFACVELLVAPVRPDVAVSLVAAAAIAASLLILPLLPSRGSNAQVFTFDRLPENETSEVARLLAKQDLVDRCALTPREAEVLDCLLDGLPHEETAERLGISLWTVKNHSRSIYAKTGAHSARELMALVLGEKVPEPPHHSGPAKPTG